MKKKFFILALIVGLGTTIFAGEKEDLAFLDELYKEKKFDMAITESKSFLDRYPSSKYNKNIQDRIAKLYFLQEDYENAIKYFKILLINSNLQGKEKDEIRYFLFRSYASLGDRETGLEYLNSIDKKSDYYEKAIYETGVSYLSLEKYDLAEKEFQELLNLKGKLYNDSILSMALLSYNKGDYNRSIAYLEEYGKLSGNKNIGFMNYLLGSAYYKLQNLELATRYFNETKAKDKDSIYARKATLNLIEIYSNKNEIGVAEEKLQKLKDTPQYNEGVRILGDSYATRGDYTKAIGYYNQVSDFSDPKLLYSYGFSLYKLDKLKEAKEYFESLKNSSYYNQALYYIFAIDYKMKNYKRIIDNREEVKKVVVNQEDILSINTIIANSAYEVGNYKLSKDYYGRNYTLRPSAENLYRIIAIDSKIGDLEDLDIRFREYKQKYPNDKKYKKDVYLSAGELYYKKNMLDESANIYKEYLEVGKDFEILDNLITVLLAKQEYTEMFKYLDETDSSPENVYLRGIASMGKGNYRDADSYFILASSEETKDAELLEKIEFNRVRNFFLWENYSETIKLGEEFLNKYPNSTTSLEVIDKVAISYFRQDNFAKSREYYEKFIDKNQNLEYASFQIADTYYAQKEYEKAMFLYKDIFTKYPDGEYGERANYWYLNSLAKAGKFAEFEREKDEFLKKYPNSNLASSVYILASQVYEDSGDGQNLMSNYEKLYESTEDEKLKEDIGTKIIDIKLAGDKLEEAGEYIKNLANLEIKSYYNSLIFEKRGEKEKALAEYKKLYAGEKYKDYAGLNLGNYYYNKKEYKKAREYYAYVDGLESSPYKDFVLYQISNIDENLGKLDRALRGYTKGYLLYKGEYADLSRLKSAEVNEKLKKNKEAFKIYKELYEIKDFKYRAFVLEKMIYYTLQNGNKVEAKKYYNELQKLDKKSAEKYNQFFN